MPSSSSEWWTENLGRTLTWIGRHAAPVLGMHVGWAGWISSKELSKCIPFTTGRFRKAKVEDVRRAAEEDDQHRIQVEEIGADEWRFRATQGHSFDIPDVGDLFKALPDDTVTALHYTGRGALRRILKSGGIWISGRVHIHLKNEMEPQLWRDHCVAIEVDVAGARAGGLEFVLSASGDVLSRGNAVGIIPQRYFRAVWLLDGQPTTWTRHTLDDPQLQEVCGQTPRYLTSRSAARRTLHGLRPACHTKVTPYNMDVNWSIPMEMESFSVSTTRSGLEFETPSEDSNN